MPRQRRTPEWVTVRLREAEVLMAQRKMVAETVRQTGVTEPMPFRSRRKDDGLNVDQAR